jgi:hypothetical protein
MRAIAGILAYLAIVMIAVVMLITESYKNRKKNPE